MRKLKRPKHVFKKMYTLTTEQGEIPYILSRSTGRRTLTITIDEKARVGVASPFNMAEREIHDFIHEKAKWIVNKLKEANKFKNAMEEKDFNHGNLFLYLGRKHKLNLAENDVKRARIGFDLLDGWTVTVPMGLGPEERRDRIKEKLLKWYKVQAKEILGGRIFHYGRIMGVAPRSIAIRSQKRLWGCCDYDKQSISLNWQIILSPIKVVDYIVVHELCHLTIPNHSKRFWKKVAKYMPDYQEQRRWLSANHVDMILP